MSQKIHLILGCGVAALSALEKIRAATSGDEIKLVTMEEQLPYSPTVLPYLIAGRTSEDKIPIADEGYFQKMKSTLVKGKEAVQVVPGERVVVYGDGDKDKYDTLLIATGSESARVPIEGIEKVGFLGFHTLADCRELLRELETKKEVAILGAGLIGMELALGLLERGCKVKVIEKEGRVLPLYFDEEVGAYVEELFCQEGAQIYVGKEAKEVRKNKGRIEIGLADGSSIDADIVVNAVGVQPRVSFLRASGVAINRGVLVDRRMKTNIGGIYAAGDVAEAPAFFSNEAGLSAILPSALEQGEIAGANMAGEEINYEGWIPSNVCNLFNRMGVSVGLAMPVDGGFEVMKENDEKGKQFKKLVFQGDKLVGAVFFGVDVQAGVIYHLIKNRVNIGPHKGLLFEKPKEVGLWLMLEAERKKASLEV